jgi:hypothetical protein
MENILIPPPPMMAEDLAEAPLIFLADEDQLWVHALLVFQSLMGY